MSSRTDRGRVTTFYSYKGGVGRSFLLANVAWLLARWGRRVLCLDWDLEAPGLHRYLSPLSPRKEGILRIVRKLEDSKRTNWVESVEKVEGAWGKNGCLHLIGAGRGDDNYIHELQTLDWKELFQSGLSNKLELMRSEWISSVSHGYDHVLIDSRTGITDVGGICAAQLPDLLVITFTPSYQSLEGAIDVANRAQKSRANLPLDRGSFDVLPVPSRIHVGEESILEEEWMKRFEINLAPLFRPWKDRKIEVREYLSHIRLDEQARWSFGEKLPVQFEPLDEPSRVSYNLANIAALVDQRLQDSGDLVRNRRSYVKGSSGEVSFSKPPPSRSYKFDVFISYPSESKEQATKIADTLRKAGITTFIDHQDLNLGSNIHESLYQARERSRNFVVLIGNKTSSDRPQWDEMTHILRREDEGAATVIPVFLDDESYAVAPPSMRKLYGLDFQQQGSIEKVAKQIEFSVLRQKNIWLSQ